MCSFIRVRITGLYRSISMQISSFLVHFSFSIFLFDYKVHRDHSVHGTSFLSFGTLLVHGGTSFVHSGEHLNLPFCRKPWALQAGNLLQAFFDTYRQAAAAFSFHHRVHLQVTSYIGRLMVTFRFWRAISILPAGYRPSLRACVHADDLMTSFYSVFRRAFTTSAYNLSSCMVYHSYLQAYSTSFHLQATCTPGSDDSRPCNYHYLPLYAVQTCVSDYHRRTAYEHAAGSTSM